MSIIDQIAAHEAGGTLVRFQPTTRRPLRRELFLTAEATGELNDPNSAIRLLGARGDVYAAMEKWVRGERIYTRSTSGGFLKRLSSPPKEIWEIRVTEPINSVRLFVRFARADSLILTHMRTRRLLGKETVRRKRSIHWTQAMIECEAIWNRLFPGWPPHSGRKLNEYVTENCDDFELNN